METVGECSLGSGSLWVGGQHQIRPTNTKKGEDMNWGLMELSKQFWERRMVNLRKVRTIEKIVGECDRHQLQDGDSKQVSGIKIGW